MKLKIVALKTFQKNKTHKKTPRIGGVLSS
jgi:hypothetical protein